MVRLIVVPAFNRMIVGTRIDRGSGSNLPLLKGRIFDIESAKVYDLGGDLLGTVKAMTII